MPEPGSGRATPASLSRAPWAGHVPRAARVTLCALACVLMGNGAPELSARELVDAVQARYDSIQDISATFDQEAKIASIERTERAGGTVTIKRPGRMRWEYTAPEPRVIALDGETIRMYVPDDAQLQIAPLSAGAFPPTALDFLLGEGKLDSSFVAERITAPDRDEVGLLLRPREDASFERLEIWVSPDTQQLRESVVVDLFGNRTAVRFREITENQGVADDVFEVQVPQGTDVIDLRTNSAPETAPD